ncbi:hypothetical protein [Methylomagnum sp.]
MRILALLSCLTLAGLSGCASHTPPRLNLDGNALTPIAAEYETVITDPDGDAHRHIKRWRFWRDADLVETRSLDTDEGEIWRRSVKGLIFYERIYHRDRKVVESNPDDLRALHREPQWHRVALLLDPSLLNAQLVFQGRESLAGRPALRYVGVAEGVEYEVWWLEHENIPGLIRQRSPEREIAVTLRETYPLNRAPWPHDTSRDYASLDYADLGDMESDPFVKRILHGAEFGHSHEHQH